MKRGFDGKVLEIDLRTQKCVKTSINDKDYRSYLGGSELAEQEVTVRLSPLFKKSGDLGEFCIKLPREKITLRQLTAYLLRERPECFAVAPIDGQGYLTSVFVVNGIFALPEQFVADNDEIIIFQRICGG